MIADGQCGGGDLSWWLAHKDTYKTVGGCINGFQGAYTYFNVALRVLANKGPKLNVLEMPITPITNANLAQFAKPGLPLSSQGRGRRPGDRVVRRHLPGQVLQRHQARPPRARGRGSRPRRPGLYPGARGLHA